MDSGNTTVRQLQVVLSADSSRLQNALSQAERATSTTTARVQQGASQVENATARMQAALKKVAMVAGAAISVKAIVDFGKSCVQLGSDLTEVQNVVDTTFGSMSGTINDFAKSAIDNFGLSETAAKKYASTLGAMIKSMGLGMGDVTEMSTTIAGLAGDMASFYNISADEAFSKLQSGISGEAEPLKQLGINLSQANLEAYALSQGITTSLSAMSQAEQVTLRYNYILDATKDAQGDVARTSGTWANQVRRLNMQFESIKANIGQGLIVALTPVIEVINNIIAKLAELSEKFRNFMQSIGIGSSESASQASPAASGLTSATEGAASFVESDLSGSLDKASKKAGNVGKNLAKGMDSAVDSAKGFLHSFDEIHAMGGGGSSASALGVDDAVVEALEDITEPANVAALRNIQEETSGGAEATADMAESMGELSQEISPVAEKAAELADTFKEGFKDGIGDNVQERIDSITDHVHGIGESVSNILSSPEVQESAENFVDTATGALGQVAGAASSVGLSIGENLLGGVDGYLEEDGDRISDRMGEILDASADTADHAGDLATSIAEILEPLGGDNGKNLTGSIVGAAGNAALDWATLASKTKADISGLIEQPITENKEGLKTAFDGLLGNASIEAEGFKQALEDVGDEATKVYDDHFSPAFKSISQDLSDVTSVWLERWNGDIQPRLEEWAKDTQEVFATHFAPAMTELINAMGDAADMIAALSDKLSKAIQDALSEDGKKENGLLTRILEGVEFVKTSAKATASGAMDVSGDFFKMIGGGMSMFAADLTGDYEKRLEAEEKYNEGLMDIGKDIGKTLVSGGYTAMAPTVAIANATPIGQIEPVSDWLDMVTNDSHAIIDGYYAVEEATEETNGLLGTIKEAIDEKFPDGMSLSEGVSWAVESMAQNMPAITEALNKMNETSATAEAVQGTKEPALTFADIVGAVSQAINSTSKDMIIYMDGEEVGRGITAALNTANVRQNPELAFGY